MKQIQLTRGKVALVSDVDFPRLKRWKWYASSHGGRWYAGRMGSRSTPPRKTIWMHREVLGVSDPKVHVDHRNGDGLNNQRRNLRGSTCQQNQRNRGKTRGSSVYKGVVKFRDKYRARITVDSSRVVHLGYFLSEIEAAKAYNSAAKKYFGRFARLNQI